MENRRRSEKANPHLLQIGGSMIKRLGGWRLFSTCSRWAMISFSDARSDLERSRAVIAPFSSSEIIRFRNVAEASTGPALSSGLGGINNGTSLNKLDRSDGIINVPMARRKPP